MHPPFKELRRSKLILVAPRNNHVIHLQHHPTQLGREEQLLSLSNQGVYYEDLAHVVAAGLHAIDAQPCVLFAYLSRFDFREGFDGTKARILGERHGDGVQGVGERAHRVLF